MKKLGSVILCMLSLIASQIDTAREENKMITIRTTLFSPSFIGKFLFLSKMSGTKRISRLFACLPKTPNLRLKGGKLGRLYHRSFDPVGPWAEIGGKVGTTIQPPNTCRETSFE